MDDEAGATQPPLYHEHQRDPRGEGIVCERMANVEEHGTALTRGQGQHHHHLVIKSDDPNLTAENHSSKKQWCLCLCQHT